MTRGGGNEKVIFTSKISKAHGKDFPVSAESSQTYGLIHDHIRGYVTELSIIERCCVGGLVGAKFSDIVRYQSCIYLCHRVYVLPNPISYAIHTRQR